MLVTCSRCKSPVFVSAAVMVSGAVEVACGACRAALRVGADGNVVERTAESAPGARPDTSMADGAAAAAAAPTRAPAEEPAVPAPGAESAPAWLVPATGERPPALAAAPTAVTDALELAVLPSYSGGPPAVPPRLEPPASGSGPSVAATQPAPAPFPSPSYLFAGASPIGLGASATAVPVVAEATGVSVGPTERRPAAAGGEPPPSLAFSMPAPQTYDALVARESPEATVRAAGTPDLVTPMAPAARGSEPYVVLERCDARLRMPGPRPPALAASPEPWTVAVAGSVRLDADPPSMFPPTLATARPITVSSDRRGSGEAALDDELRAALGGGPGWRPFIYAAAGVAAAMVLFAVLRAMEPAPAEVTVTASGEGSAVAAVTTALSEPASTPLGAGTADARTRALYRRANALIAQGQPTAAIEQLERCIELAPGHALAYRSLAVAYMLVGRERSAVTAYERFVELAPEHRDTPSVRKVIASYRERQPGR